MEKYIGNCQRLVNLLAKYYPELDRGYGGIFFQKEGYRRSLIDCAKSVKKDRPDIFGVSEKRVAEAIGVYLRWKLGGEVYDKITNVGGEFGVAGVEAICERYGSLKDFYKSRMRTAVEAKGARCYTDYDKGLIRNIVELQYSKGYKVLNHDEAVDMFNSLNPFFGANICKNSFNSLVDKLGIRRSSRVDWSLKVEFNGDLVGLLDLALMCRERKIFQTRNGRTDLKKISSFLMGNLPWGCSFQISPAGLGATFKRFDLKEK